jgi:uncharacterized protein (TIGR01244 family)
MFRKVTETFYASPQIAVEDIAEAGRLGITLIINNRPEDESEDQTPGSAIAQAARAAGINYVAIPVSHAGFSETQVSAMTDALKQSSGPALAYCRSGTRSTLLWSLAEASCGRNPQKIAAQAANAGYDVSPVRALIDMFAANASHD